MLIKRKMYFVIVKCCKLWKYFMQLMHNSEHPSNTSLNFAFLVNLVLIRVIVSYLDYCIAAYGSCSIVICSTSLKISEICTSEKNAVNF